MLGQVELLSEACRRYFEVFLVKLCYDDFSGDEKVIGTEDEEPLVKEVEEETLKIISYIGQ